MKKYFVTITALLLLCGGVYSQSQTILDGKYINPEKTVVIMDMRSVILEGLVDTSTRGHKAGEIYAERLSGHNYLEEKNDIITFYAIHFVIQFKNELKNFSRIVYTKQDFDKASYAWLSDTDVSVTLINSATNKKRAMQFSKPSVNETFYSMNVKEGSLQDADYEK